VPADLTIFAAKYLLFIAAALAVVMLAIRLWQQPRFRLVQWALFACLLLLLSYLFAVLGGAIYHDPRPFTTSHVPPLIPHAADNGFPSDHALLAAALVALVASVDLVWALPLVLLAVLIDWARVGAGIHHLIDVAGSSLLVALAALIALFVAPRIAGLIAPHLPVEWKERSLAGSRTRWRPGTPGG
jgi:undecaprenyl-diphosphatase